MLSKKFFYRKESLFDEINVKKFLNKNFYAKFLVRSSLLNSKTINVLDTSTKIYNVSKSDLEGLLQKKISPLEGFSLNSHKTVYTNKRNTALRFESFLCNFSSSVNLLETVYQSFKCLQLKSASGQNSLIILKPIKGGFCSYCSGIIGFLPRSHGLMIMKKILFLSVKMKVTQNKHLLDYFHYFLALGKFTNKYFTPRLLFNLGQAVVYSRFKKNNFSSSSRKKKDFSTEYNFVFLFKNISENIQPLKKDRKENGALSSADAQSFVKNRIISTKNLKQKKLYKHIQNGEIKKIARK